MKFLRIYESVSLGISFIFKLISLRARSNSSFKYSVSNFRITSVDKSSIIRPKNKCTFTSASSESIILRSPVFTSNFLEIERVDALLLPQDNQNFWATLMQIQVDFLLAKGELADDHGLLAIDELVDERELVDHFLVECHQFDFALLLQVGGHRLLHAD